jgi:ubiquinone/menaquinone biosynthesis C-methylase UbiE
MSAGFTNWLYYRFGARVYEKVLGTWTLGGWWRWQRSALRDLPTDQPILELGCGTGRLLAQRLEAGPAVGLDISLPMLRQAKRRINGTPLGAPVLIADAGKLPFDDGTFGAVISTGVLTAMPEIRPALAEARRVLRPGGKMAFVEMMPPARPTIRGRLAMAALLAVRDRFHDLPGLLGELGLRASDREIGRAGTVHLVTAVVD